MYKNLMFLHTGPQLKNGQVQLEQCSLVIKVFLHSKPL